VLKLNPLVFLLLLFFICYTIHYFGRWVKLTLRHIHTHTDLQARHTSIQLHLLRL
jgi:hypothetical protein